MCEGIRECFQHFKKLGTFLTNLFHFLHISAIVHQNSCSEKEPRHIGVESMSQKMATKYQGVPSCKELHITYTSLLLAAAGVVAVSRFRQKMNELLLLV